MSQLAACPDIVRAYHEAGHAALDLILGYGLAYCSIEPQGSGIGGETRRISEMVADGHYSLLVAAGTWAEGLSGYDFAAAPCEDGGEGDRANLEQVLLDAFEVPAHERDARAVSDTRRAEIGHLMNIGYEQVFTAVTNVFAEPGRAELVHELAALLMEHRTLPDETLGALNDRYPMEGA